MVGRSLGVAAAYVISEYGQKPNSKPDVRHSLVGALRGRMTSRGSVAAVRATGAEAGTDGRSGHRRASALRRL